MRALFGIALLVTSVTAACFSAEAEQMAPPRAIQPDEASESAIEVNLLDYSFELSTATAPAGTTDFVLQNSGSEDHEFVIVPVHGDRLDLPLGEIEGFAPGETRAIRADLAPGDYALVCLMVSIQGDQPQSHMALGMRAGFKVTR